MSTPAQIPMIAPDGTPGMVDYGVHQQLADKGYKPGMVLYAPDGTKGVVDMTQMGKYLKAGYRTNINPADQASSGQPQAQAPQSRLEQVLNTVGDLGKGAVKSVANTAANVDDAVAKIPGIGTALTTPLVGSSTSQQARAALHQAAQTHGTAQAVGNALGSAAQFLIPGAAEEQGIAALGLAPKAAAAARIGAQALSSGAINAAQGGDFKTGALVGGAGGVVGEGLKAVAPMIAQSAIGIRKVDRAFGKTPGQAIIDSTTGVRPETVAASAQKAIDPLMAQNDAMVAGSQSPHDLSPALKIIDDAFSKAVEQNNESAVNQLGKLRDALTKHVVTGAPIPAQVSAEQAQSLMRGVREQFVNYNPDTLAGTQAVAARAAGSIKSGLEADLGPQFAQNNQRISSLIPVAKRAESTALNAGAVQQTLGKLTRPTGALTSTVGGAIEGRREGGVEGAIAGGALGLLLPQLVGSPTGQMILARLAAKGISPAATGLALQANKGGNR